MEQRAQVDQEAELIRQEVDNMNQQLQQYNLLIAEKQAEVDGLLQRQSELLDRYKQRIRAMQEQGDISYWAVIFRANSFSDMLNRVAMVEEIAKSDQRMMDELRSMASEVLDAKNALADEKAAIEQKKVELAAAEEALAAKREESESLLDELIANAQLLAEEDEKYESLQNELADEIAKKEQEYNQKVEEERKAYEAAQKGNGGNVGTNENGDPFIVAPKNESFIFPLPTNIGSCITSPYGHALSSGHGRLQIPQRRGLCRQCRPSHLRFQERHRHDGDLHDGLGQLCGDQPRRRLFDALRAYDALYCQLRRIR